MLRRSIYAVGNFSVGLKVLLITLPVITFFTLARTKAAPSLVLHVGTQQLEERCRPCQK